MKKVILFTLCLVMLLSGMAMAGSLVVSGNMKVFNIFGAVTATATIVEPDGTPLAGPSLGAAINGDYQITANFPLPVFRQGCIMKGFGSYFAGFLHVYGQYAMTPIAVADGTTTITSIDFNLQ
jgi:hypothetical protein